MRRWIIKSRDESAKEKDAIVVFAGGHGVLAHGLDAM